LPYIQINILALFTLKKAPKPCEGFGAAILFKLFLLPDAQPLRFESQEKKHGQKNANYRQGQIAGNQQE
jgi:hypothetical protein